MFSHKPYTVCLKTKLFGAQSTPAVWMQEAFILYEANYGRFTFLSEAHEILRHTHINMLTHFPIFYCHHSLQTTGPYVDHGHPANQWLCTISS